MSNYRQDYEKQERIKIWSAIQATQDRKIACRECGHWQDRHTPRCKNCSIEFPDAEDKEREDDKRREEWKKWERIVFGSLVIPLVVSIGILIFKLINADWEEYWDVWVLFVVFPIIWWAIIGAFGGGVTWLLQSPIFLILRWMYHPKHEGQPAPDQFLPVGCFTSSEAYHRDELRNLGEIRAREEGKLDHYQETRNEIIRLRSQGTLSDEDADDHLEMIQGPIEEQKARLREIDAKCKEFELELDIIEFLRWSNKIHPLYEARYGKLDWNQCDLLLKHRASATAEGNRLLDAWQNETSHEFLVTRIKKLLVICKALLDTFEKMKLTLRFKDVRAIPADLNLSSPAQSGIAALLDTDTFVELTDNSVFTDGSFELEKEYQRIGLEREIKEYYPEIAWALSQRNRIR